MKLNHGSILVWPIPQETNINCPKASTRKKIQKQKNIMKNNSNHIVIKYLHFSEKQKILTITNVLKTTTKILG